MLKFILFTAIAYSLARSNLKIPRQFLQLCEYLSVCLSADGKVYMYVSFLVLLGNTFALFHECVMNLTCTNALLFSQTQISESVIKHERI